MSDCSCKPVFGHKSKPPRALKSAHTNLLYVRNNIPKKWLRVISYLGEIKSSQSGSGSQGLELAAADSISKFLQQQLRHHQKICGSKGCKQEQPVLVANGAFWPKTQLRFCVSSDLMPPREIHRCSCFCQPWTVHTAAASRQPRCPSSSSLGVMAEPGSPEAPAEAPQRHKGVTKWFNATKGYGFVTPIVEGDEQPEEIFVHQVRSE